MIGLAVFLILAVGVLGVWWARPITWRDGEGPVQSWNGDEPVGTWVLGRLLRALPFWR